MRRALAPVLIAAALALTACAPGGTATEAPTPTAETSAAPTPTAGADSPSALILGVDGIAVVEDGQIESLPLDAPEPLLALVEELTAQPREGEDFEDPWGNGEVWGTRYEWDAITISVLKDGPASITVLAATVGDVPVGTTDGVAVGSSRDAVLAAGGWDEWDEDGDGRADYLGVEAVDVEGTQSLSRPGEVGREFISVALDDDVVVELRSPANDFSDL